MNHRSKKRRVVVAVGKTDLEVTEVRRSLYPQKRNHGSACAGFISRWLPDVYAGIVDQNRAALRSQNSPAIFELSERLLNSALLTSDRRRICGRCARRLILRAHDRAYKSLSVLLALALPKTSPKPDQLWMTGPLRWRIGIRMVLAFAPKARAKIFHKDTTLCQQIREQEHHKGR